MKKPAISGLGRWSPDTGDVTITIQFMWLGLSEQWWQELLSGVVGATVAAGISVLVALIVVSRTNANHREVLDAELRFHLKAELIVRSEQAFSAYHGGADSITAAYEAVDEAATKLRLVVYDDMLSRELIFWPNFLRTLAMRIIADGEPDREAFKSSLMEATFQLNYLVEVWPERMDGQRVTSVLNDIRRSAIEKHGLRHLDDRRE